MHKSDGKIKRFFASHKDYVIATSVFFVLYCVTLIINQDWPFGSNTILMSDSYAQVGNLTTLIFDIFEGKSTLTYTNALGGGMEILSTIEYMFMCPFYLIALMGGRSNIFYMYNLATFFILLFDLYVFLWFVRKYFKNIPTVYKILLSLLFVYSAYTLTGISFLTWLMYPGILLLLVDAFLRMLKTGKNGRFCVILVWYVCTCFSVGISTAIMLFLVFTLFILFMSKGEHQKSLSSRLMISYIISALASVVILFPGLMGFFQLNRTNNLMLGLMSAFEGGKYATKLIPLLLDAAIEGVAICFLFGMKKKSQLFKFFVVCLVVLFVPVAFDCSLRLFCGSTYIGFPSRFYFLNECVFFILAMMFFEKQAKERLAESKTSPIAVLIFSLLSVIMVLVFSLSLVFMGENLSIVMKDPLDGSDILFLLSIFFIGIVVMLLVCLFSKKRQMLSARAYQVCTAILLIFSLSFSYISLSLYAKKDIGAEKRSLIQTEGLSGKFNGIINEQINYNVYSENLKNNQVFSSLIAKNNASFRAMGYLMGNSMVTNVGATLISDSLCGNRYCLASKDFSRPYLVKIREEGSYAIFENTLATTGAIVFDSDFTFDFDLCGMEGLTKFKDKLGVDGELEGSGNFKLEKVEMEDVEVAQEMSHGFNLYHLSYLPNQSEIVYSNVVSLNSNSKIVSEKFAGKNVFIANESSEDKTFELAFAEAGKQLDVYMFISKTIDESTIKITTINYEVAKNICTKLQSMQAEVTYKSDGYVVNAEISDQGILMITSPDIVGYAYTLNGSVVQADDVLGYFPTIRLESGKNSLDVTYHYPHTKLWVIVAAFVTVLIVGLAMVYKFVKANWLKNILLLSNIVIFSAIITIFEILGIILTFIVI